MGFRFRQNIGLGKGIRLNLGKRTMSLSLGRRGATINIGRRGVTGTVGVPGTGMSYSERILDNKANGKQQTAAKPQMGRIIKWTLLILLALIIAALFS